MEAQYAALKSDSSIELTKIQKYALRYAERGLAVLPVQGVDDGKCTCGNSKCENIGKHPATKQGYKDATKDPYVIISRFNHQQINIGVTTGVDSGIVVVDIDITDIYDGKEYLHELEKIYGVLPDTATVLTGRGFHLYFKLPPGKTFQSKVNFNPLGKNFNSGIDIRCEGAYVVAPPSRHKSGREYIWEVGTEGLAELPEWFAGLLDAPSSKVPAFHDLTTQQKIQEGTRNHSLFKLAASLRSKGLSCEAITAALQIENKKTCAPPLPEAEVQKIAMGQARYPQGQATLASSEPWPVPSALPSPEGKAMKLSEELIPDALKKYVLDSAEEIQVPAEMILIPMLVSLSSIIGKKIAIKPKARAKWLVHPNLWGMVVAPTGSCKSPSMGRGLKPIESLDSIARKQYKEEKEFYEQSLIHSEGKKPPQSPPPIRSYYKINDATVEKLAIIMEKNNRCILTFRDELYAFFKNLEKPERASDRSFYLEGYNGDGKFSIGRVSRSEVDIDGNCIAILGGIQPERLMDYFKNEMQSGSGDDGFISRFQMAVYPDINPNWSYTDNEDDIEAEEKVIKLFSTIDEFDFNNLDLPKKDGIPYISFDTEAQKLFVDWYKSINILLRKTDSGISKIFLAYVAKQPKTMPALALQFHLLDFFSGKTDSKNISVEATSRAIKWIEFLNSHAAKIYGLHKQSGLKSVRELARRIQVGAVKNGMSVRNIYTKHWSGLETQGEVRNGLSVLESLGWLRVEEVSPQTGRPSEIVLLSPRLNEIISLSSDRRSP